MAYNVVQPTEVDEETGLDVNGRPAFEVYGDGIPVGVRVYLDYSNPDAGTLVTAAANVKVGDTNEGFMRSKKLNDPNLTFDQLVDYVAQSVATGVVDRQREYNAQPATLTIGERAELQALKVAQANREASERAVAAERDQLKAELEALKASQNNQE